MNFTLDPFFLYTSGTDEFANGFVHGASNVKGKPTEIELTGLEFNAEVTDVNVHEAGIDDESYPSHSAIPVLLYIGGR